MSPSADYRFTPFAFHSYRFSPTISVPTRGSYSSLGEIGFPLPRSACAAFVLSIGRGTCDMVVAAFGVPLRYGGRLAPSYYIGEYRLACRLASNPERTAKLLLYLGGILDCLKKNCIFFVTC
jgi:hypothetical protein